MNKDFTKAATKQVEQGGFADIEAARKKTALAVKLKAAEHKFEASASEIALGGDPTNRAARNVGFNENSFWNDKEAKKLSHTSVYTATRQTATRATNGYRTTPAMNDPYQYSKNHDFIT